MPTHKHNFLIPLNEQLPADPRRKSKLIDLDEAGKIIATKKIFSIAGSHSADAAMSLIRAAIRAGAKGMTLIPPITTSLAADLPIAAGMLKKLYLSYVGFEVFGMAPAFRKAAETQSMEIVEADEPFILLGTQAAAGGKPFNAVQYIYDGTDHKRLNPELKQVVDPFTGRTVWAIPPLRADVFIMHAQACDEYGNAQCWGGTGQERDKAKAADMVIVQADEIVGSEVIQKDPSHTTVPGLWVDYVVHAPYGAHPTFSSNSYAVDEDHLKTYIDLVRAGKAQEYIDKYVLEPKDHYDYLERIGGLRRLTQLRSSIAVRS
jgi:glutaconate CoA-transferase, subunit A